MAGRILALLSRGLQETINIVSFFLLLGKTL